MRLRRALLVSLLLVCFLTGAVNAQSCTPLTGVQIILDGAQYLCRTSTGGTYTATEYGGGTSSHQWVYSASSAGPWTAITGATGTTYQLRGSDFPSNGLWWVAVTATPQCGSPVTGGAQSVTVYDALRAPDTYGPDQICAEATNAVAQSAAQWDSYSWSIAHGTLIAGPNGCGNDPTKKCISWRPDGTGDVALTLTVTAGSCSATGTRVVPLVPNAPPLLNVPSPICPTAGTATTSQFPAGIRTWSVTNGHIEADYGDFIHFAADGSGPVVVTLTFTDSNGCSSTSSATAQLMATKPVVTLGASSCANSGSASASGGWNSYQWSITNGTITGGQGTANITFSASPGSVTLTATGRTDYSTFTCTMASDPVTVPSTPAPSITLGSQDVCPYGSDTATAPAGFTNYWWSVTNGYITAGDGTNSITFRPGGGMPGTSNPVTISLMVQGANGCPSPQTTVTAPIRSIPAPQITLATPDVCPYGSDTATVPAQYANYWWQVTGGYITGGDGTNSITFRPGGGYPGSGSSPVTISLFVQDANGCPSPQATATVPIRTIPAPQITLATSDVCPYGSDTATVPAQYANYWWQVTGGYITGGDGTNSITFRPGGGYPGSSSSPVTISLFVQDANGCPSPQATATVPIRSIPAPQITLATPDVCNLGSDTASVPAQYANYFWLVTNGNIISGDGTNSITFRPSGGMPGSNNPVTISLFVQDANGCPSPQATATVPLRTIPAPQITLDTSDVCPNGSDTASVPAQYANYYWLITNGNITSGLNTNTITFTPLNSTDPVTLSISVQDANACNANSASVTVPIRTIPAPAITLGAAAVCPGATDSASVPSSYASYTWTVANGTILNGSSTNAITFRADGAGNPAVSVRVSDANGCAVTTASSTVTLNAVPVPHISVSQQYSSLAPSSYVLAQVSGGNTYTYCGSFITVGLFATGGGTGAHFHWSTGAATPGISVTQSGVYTVTITNAEGCSADASVTININPYPTATITAGGPLDICPNGGSVVLTANAADSYLWSTGETTRSITVAQPGSYNVRVTTGGCSATSNDTVVTLRSPGVITGGRTFCPDGSVTLTAPAGASYAWTTGANTQSITVSTAGDYSVTVTDATGCAMTPPSATVTASSLAVSVTATATTICEGQTSTLTANPTGGTGTYSYQWFNGMGPISGATSQSYAVTVFQGYYVVVTDAGGCGVSTVNQPVIVNVNASPHAYINVQQNSFCSGTAYTVYAAGTTSPITATWTVTNGTLQSTSGNSAVIVAGASGSVTIGLTATNSNGCSSSSTQSVPIVQPPPVPAISASGPTTFCQGGQVTLTAPAGYSYTWRVGTYVFDTTQSITTGLAGNYTVTVTNAGGCSTTSQPFAVNINPLPDATITAPTSICASTNGENARVPSLSGGSYAWTISGGTITNGAGTYLIAFRPSGSGAVTLGVTVTDANGCTASSSRIVDVRSVPKPAVTPAGAATFCNSGVLTAPAGYSAYSWKLDGGQISGASAQTYMATQSGTYSVIVWDNTSCSVESDPVSVTVSTTPSASISTTSTVCPGSTYGAVTSPSTGSTYQWSVANGTIADGQGTNIIHYTSGTSGNVTLTLTVTNSQGCSDTQSVTVPIDVVQATITPSGPLTICPAGSVTLTASAGTGYTWSNGANTQSITVTQPGTYSVRVFDPAGCNALSQPVTVSMASPSATITPSGPTTFCAGGSVTLSAPSGYTYTWSNGATSQSITVNQSNTYTVTVTDATGCTASSSATVTVNPLPQVTFTTPATVCGTSESAQEVQPGTGLTYNWSIANGTVTQNAGHRVYFTANAGASQVVLTVTITDANGCSNSGSITLPVHTPPAATIIPSGPTTFCAGGSVTLTAPAGMSSYAWSNGATTQSIVVSTSGSYSVTVRDASFCSATSAPMVVAVNATPSPSITAGGPTTFCAGGSVTLTASSGASYLWSNGATAQSISVSSSGSYSVTVTNTNGCSATSTPTTVTVNANPAPSITAGGPTTFCAGGSVTLTAPAGYSYTWSNGATTQSITVSASNNYSVTVRDANGCSGTSAPATVTVRPRPTATVSGGGAICPGGSATITATLTGTAPWSVTWSDNVTQTINTGTTASRSVSPASATTYTVTVLGDANCSGGTSSGSAPVTIKTLPTATVSGGGAICPGASATITAALTGTAPWSVTWSDNVTQTINTGTTATRSVSPAATTTYTVTSVSDAKSCPRAGSGSATVTRNTAAAITTQPTNKTTTRNTNVTLSVVASGTSPISYKWFKGNGTAIAGATSSSYTTSFSNKGTNTFYVEVWNACNATHVKSNTVTVTVN